MTAMLIISLLSLQAAQDLLKPDSLGKTGYWATFGGEWRAETGALLQTKPGYDIGATTRRRTPAKPYRISLTFQTRGDYVGAGVLFNCRDRKGIAHSMMVRVDNDTLLCGYFDDAATFVPTATPGVATKPGAHTLSVVVDNEKMRYNAIFDGQRLVTNGTLEYAGGYIGITSSGGAHAFTGLTLREATKAELSGLKSSKMPQPIGIAVGRYHAYVLTRAAEPIQVFNQDRFLVRKIGKGLSSPRRIQVVDAAGKDSLLIDCDAELVRLDPFTGRIGSRWKKPAAAIAGAPLGAAQYAWVTSDKQVVVQDLTTGSMSAHPAPELNKPTCAAVSADGRTLYVADSDIGKGKFETHVYGVSDSVITFKRSFSSWLDPRSMATLPSGNLVYVGGLGYYESGGCVRILSDDGRRVANASLFAFGTMSRRGAVAAGQGHIWVTDPDADCVYVLGEDLKEADPIVTHNDDFTTIRWSGPMMEEEGGEMEIGTDLKDENRYNRYTPKRIGDGWESHISGLRPNTRYFYRFAPASDLLADERESRVHTLVTPPAHGKRQAVEVRIVIAIYLKTFADGKNHWTIPEAGALDKVKREFEKGRLFYWRNSRCRFHTKLAKFVVIPDTEAVVNGGWMEPAQARRDLAPILAADGEKLSDYDSFVTVWADPGFRAEGSDELGAVGGGGLTPYGYSTFGISGRLAWLFVHEYNHQIDAFYDRAGSVKYWLNHPEATIHPGRYGQHFDCNAFINRNWRDDEYFTNSNFGRIILYDDRDEDGLPDDDVSLPMDDKRFGSDAGRKDTDADGLDDLAEFMAGTFSASNPRLVDSDGDGLADGKDPFPLYSAPNSVPMDRAIPLTSPNALYPAGSDPSPSPSFDHGSAELSWSAQGLGLLIRHHSTPPPVVEFDVDWNNDGWFTGADNRSFRFDTSKVGESVVGDDVTLTRLFIPAKDLGASELRAGHRFGIRLRVSGGATAVSPFDPWSLFEMELR